MKLAPLALVLGLLVVGCGDSAGAGASASASATAAPKPTTPPPASTPSASASADSGPVLPGTALKDVLKDLKSIMALTKTSGPMGSMISDKKDIGAFITAVGMDQELKTAFDSKCVTPTRFDFQSKDNKSLGVLSFCDTDEALAKARFDGSGAADAAITIKDPAGLKAVLKKVGALK